MKIKQAFPVMWDALKMWWNDWANQVVVCLAAILLSLTVILYPAALFGVFHQALDLTHGVRTGIAGFWQGIKLNIKTSLLWGLVNTVVIALLGMNIWFYFNSDQVLAPFVFVSGFMLLTWMVWQFYSVACLFLQEDKSLKLAFQNGIAVILNQPGYTLVIGLLAVALTLVSLRYFIPLVLGVESLLALLALRAVQATLPREQIN